MRIERLLSDLEARLEAEAALEVYAERAEVVRVENSAVALADRLRAHAGSSLSLSVAGSEIVGHLADVGQGWVALAARPGHCTLESTDDLVRPGITIVPLGSVEAVTGLDRVHTGEQGAGVGRGWTSLLRAVARSRLPVAWHVGGGQTFVGVVEAVGDDHVVMTRSPSRSSVALSWAHLSWCDVCAPQG